ncbi:MAG TPA: ADOP family duplicated permease [Gemmatimonadales bacterium]|nr:ADOP family duplicated permease [Gemmatimonadales bacterium]
MDTLIQDLRYAARGLIRTPGFTIAVVATLALGIGANTTMFGVLDRLLLKPPAHVLDPGRVARVYFEWTWEGRPELDPTASIPSYESLRSVPAFAATAASFDARLSEGVGGDARPVNARAVTASYFPLLGVRAARGRLFDSTEDQPGAAPAAVVSYGFWRRDLGGDPGVLRRTLPMGRFNYAIIGVAPEGFTGADLDEPDVWLPLRVATPDLWPSNPLALRSRGSHWIQVLVRLAPEQTPGSAAAQATFAHRGAARGSDQPSDSAASIVLGPIQEARGPEMPGNAKVALWVGAVALIALLVACANVANLLVARGLRRGREMAVRVGLGAGPARLARQLLVESLVLGVAGGIAGLLVALWGGALLRVLLLPGLPASASLTDLRALAFAAIAATLTGLAVGVIPAWQGGRTDVARALRSGGRDVGGARSRLRSTLLAAQVALTFALLAGAGLFVRSLRNVETLDYGLDVRHLLTADMDVRTAVMGCADCLPGPLDRQSALYLALLRHIQADPTVAAAAAAVGTPFGWRFGVRFRASGVDSLPGGGPYVSAVSADWFATAGTRIVRGRGFGAADDEPTAPPVAVVDETLAQRAWPGRSAIGQCLYLNGNDSTCVEVVGVAQRARMRGASEPPVPMYYVPLGRRLVPMPVSGLVIRTRAPAALVQGEIQRALQRAEPGLPFVHVAAISDALVHDWRSWRIGATMFSAFGLLALVIASLGVYAVTAYGVSQRTQEMGVRIALGAQRGDVIRLALAQSVRATAAGAAVGLAGALALSRAVRALLFDVAPLDLASLAGSAALVVVVAAVASYVPARRAAAVDPMEALRTE